MHGPITDPIELARLSLGDAFLRLDRAGEHVADIEARIEAFGQTQRDKLKVLVEAHVQGFGLRNEFDAPPRTLSVVMGETIYNLRAALDYLVYALAWLDSREHQTKTQFPIEDTCEGFRGRRNTFLKGVSDEHVAAIKRLQPFDGCQWIKALRDISNADKHWTLAVTTATQSGEIEFDPPIPSPVPEAYARDFAEGKVNVKHDPTIGVTFLQGPPVGEGLRLLESEVRSVLQAFEPEFERTSTVNDQV